MAEHYSIVGIAPHVLLIVASATCGIALRARWQVLLVTSVCALTGGLLYWFVQNGMYPTEESIRLGHGLAAFTAAALPSYAAGLAARSMSGDGMGWHRLALAVTAGAAVLLFVPGFQLFFGCAFTGICL
jgi:hypothetical protein